MLQIPEHDWGNVESPWISADMEIWQLLTEGRKPVKYKAEQMVFQQGDDFHSAFIVASGRVRISVFNDAGQQKTLYIACPGAMIGESSCILSHPHTMSAVAIVDSELYRVPSKELQRFFHSDQVLADLLLQYEARKNHTLISQAASLSFDSAEQRIAKTLLYLCDTYGVVTSSGIKLNISFTCNDIADVVNVSRVTVNNTMSAFRRDGIIEKADSRYYIKDLERLQGIPVEMIEF